MGNNYKLSSVITTRQFSNDSYTQLAIANVVNHPTQSSLPAKRLQHDVQQLHFKISRSKSTGETIMIIMMITDSQDTSNVHISRRQQHHTNNMSLSSNCDMQGNHLHKLPQSKFCFIINRWSISSRVSVQVS